PSRKADKGRAKFLAEATLTNPSTGFAGCCARAISGHATADAVAALMKSRRRIVAPRCRGNNIVSTQPGGLEGPMSTLGQKQTDAVHKGMSALALKATEIADIEGLKGRAFFALPLLLKRLPAPLSQGHHPHRCLGNEQYSLSSCDLTAVGRRGDCPCGDR